ncbi:rho family GTPase Rho3 [Schizosaccharomyces cryophilus OY26]|uniref:GTP-binding protein RHO3 n=1 Tax=Schizosaccharomyces cryophilus (strain OY26 / ATCC MYA-4695 / CBS 11777 / NBRC 106824 / NRRL Y48691) TaxID=653667 RepID=S9XAK5_SCHCR|nr:rho family GTPase Rho3 [Schizosaccharomyces cryophilus OY26]EPY50791.1 rho family GTPase Rho3 [Schizosaccharomyces cryophilus OY26]
MFSCFGRKKRSIYRKIVILGDGAAGKTSLLNVFTKGYFPQVYEPTIFENYIHDIFVDGNSIELSLWDTAGQEEYDQLRSLSYSDTHVIMICFAVDSPDSLENVISKWLPEVASNCPSVKLVLVALKCDLRGADDDQPNSTRIIGYEEGLAAAKKINAVRYLECSAKLNRGVNEAFTEAARVALAAQPRSAKDNADNFHNTGCIIC